MLETGREEVEKEEEAGEGEEERVHLEQVLEVLLDLQIFLCDFVDCKWM